jgi:hypothetical protein
MYNYIEQEQYLVSRLKSEYKIKIEDACFSTGWIPKHILLDKTRNIHSYIVFASISKNNFFGRYFSNNSDFGLNIYNLIKTQFSNLDRPLFFIIQDEKDDIQCIEGNEVREHILANDSILNLNQMIMKEAFEFKNIINKIKSEL